MANEIQPDAVAFAAERLTSAKHVCALTGAGISAESGIPTFRGQGGFWAGHRAEDLATPEAFTRDPELVWQFYLWRRSQLATRKPNPGHIALAEIENRAARFTLITQNVDDLHRLGGSRNIIELHGNLWIDRCTACRHEVRLTPDDAPPPSESFEDQSHPIPHCDKCGAMMRPGVVWFGETLPPRAIESAQTAACHCDLLLVIGTSSLVQPAASLAHVARASGAYIIEINPDDTPLSPHVDLRFPHPAGQALPQIVENLNET